MPQLFPMNWMLLTIFFSIAILISFIKIYFFPDNFKKYNISMKNFKTYFFKW
uniref:ATP synthase F0 subunit 8 n=1 Tax=Ixodes kohlsi TaxID=2995590 RepID=UPI00286C927D|nr:ATP synthase F0 subunit 8 [Ixodes kohlsi]WKW95293.1 ATP synthase subunit 8 [Ixodes kohlsi]WKW95306.1 ATP synthase subunit 8 [Ixodes kohlsi]